jgi:hypothetical protein
MFLFVETDYVIFCDLRISSINRGTAGLHFALKEPWAIYLFVVLLIFSTLFKSFVLLNLNVHILCHICLLT